MIPRSALAAIFALAVAARVAADARAPRILWSAPTPASGDWVLGLAIGPDDTIYARTWTGTTIVGFAPDGAVRRTLEVGRPTGAMVVARDGTHYASSDDGVVHVFGADGVAIRTFASPAAIVALATTSDGLLCAASSRGDVYAFDPSGAVRWKHETGRPLDGLTVGRDGLVRVGLGDGVHVLGPDGGFRARIPVPPVRLPLQSIAALVMPGDDVLYVSGRARHVVHALDLTNGITRWTFEARGTPFALAQADDGTIYVGSFDGNVHALDPERGAVRWRITAGAGAWGKRPVHALAVAKDGTIYAGAGASVVAIAPPTVTAAGRGTRARSGASAPDARTAGRDRSRGG